MPKIYLDCLLLTSRSAQNGGQEEEHREWRENLAKQYNGGHHRSAWIKFQRPRLNDSQLKQPPGQFESTYRKLQYMNPWGDHEHVKYPDLDACYSSTKRFPRHWWYKRP
ncbi:hypothetical protein BDW59DRAFT_163491 [Aspergillus cavernicola]|uniref:Berberine/berberine-like domain-containing protein n=1 Tax=Aspergillus cavernicola TaxID=176166 RepID=A0ABR4I5V4_9EURO